jgi:cell division septation protein DedD
MQQLILEYNPIMQSRGGIGLRSLWRSWMTPSERAFHPQGTLTREEYHQKHVVSETKAAHRPFFRHDTFGFTFDPDFQIVRRDAMKPFIGARFNRDKFLLAGAICSVLLLVTSFAMLPDLQSSARMVLAHISSVMQRTTSAEEEARVRSLEPSRETEITGERSTADNGPSGLENDRDTQQQTEKGIDQFAAENSAPVAITPPKNSAPVGIEERGKRPQLPSLEKTGKHWAVQVMATPDRGVATVWIEKLKAKGYEAFVVEAEIDGKTWYRVRLGNFKTRRDAETLGALVRLKEGFHDAFVSDSTKSEIVALDRLR